MMQLLLSILISMLATPAPATTYVDLPAVMADDPKQNALDEVCETVGEMAITATHLAHERKVEAASGVRDLQAMRTLGARWVRQNEELEVVGTNYKDIAGDMADLMKCGDLSKEDLKAFGVEVMRSEKSVTKPAAKAKKAKP